MDQNAPELTETGTVRRKLINFYCLRVSSLSQNYESYLGDEGESCFAFSALMKAREQRQSFETDSDKYS
jgi:hypothetical protein